MVKLVEMDERIKLNDQLEEEIDGPLILINKFNVIPEKIEQFLKDWRGDATRFIQQPGFVSAQLHKGIGKSSVFINYAVWNSVEYFKKQLIN